MGDYKVKFKENTINSEQFLKLYQLQLEELKNKEKEIDSDLQEIRELLVVKKKKDKDSVMRLELKKEFLECEKEYNKISILIKSDIGKEAFISHNKNVQINKNDFSSIYYKLNKFLESIFLKSDERAIQRMYSKEYKY